MPEPKLGSVSPEMRHVLSLTGLGTAVGAGAGALTADEGHRFEGAALGGLAGGAYSAGIGGTQAGIAHTFLPEVARADALRSIRSIGDLALQGGVSGLIGGTAASTLTSDAAEPKLGNFRYTIPGALTGGLGGYAASDDGKGMQGALTGAALGAGLGLGADMSMAALPRGLDPDALKKTEDAMRALTAVGAVPLGAAGGAAASALSSDEPSSKIAAILRKTAATLRAEHAADQQSKIATAQHTVRAAAALHTLRT